MKIRIGFVSNSSTTSFCIMGICINREIAEKLFDVDKYDGLNTTEFDHYSRPDYGKYYYIGLNIHQMEDNETKDEFRQRVKSLFEQKCGKEAISSYKFDFITDGWYDG